MNNPPDTLSAEQGNRRDILGEAAEKIANFDDPLYFKEYPEIWDVVYDISSDSRYARAAKMIFLAGARHLEAELLRERERSRGLFEALVAIEETSNEPAICLMAMNAITTHERSVAAYRASAKEGEKYE